MTDECENNKGGTTEAQTNRGGKAEAQMVTMELPLITATLFMLHHQADADCLSVALLYTDCSEQIATVEFKV